MRRIRRLTLPATLAVVLAVAPGSVAHENEEGGDPVGPGAEAFSALDIVLKKRIALSEFGSHSAGNDCWGYVSPSGREYALMGLNNAVAVVEITDPALPEVIGKVAHPSSTWADIKTFADHAFVVNESGGGLQIFTLAQVDIGDVGAPISFTDNNLSTAHNIAINEDSGYAYLCGSNIGGMVAIDISSPTSPQIAGSYSRYVHDAHVVTMGPGPNEGREIAFCFVEEDGVDIVDVTDKSNMILLSRTTYPGLAYSHQGWFDPATNLLYQNDELDERNGLVSETTTRVFDVSDLSNPQLITTFSTGLPSIDHNLYLDGDLLFQANYTSGVHIWDVSDPLAPVRVGFLDTRPETDTDAFQGAWSVYPYFPSGNIIVSDIERGLFILDATFARMGGAPLRYHFPFGPPPDELDPSGGTFQFHIHEENGGARDDSTAKMIVTNQGVETEIPLTLIENDTFEATFPALSCGDEITYYFKAETTDGIEVRGPLSAPNFQFAAVVAREIAIPLEDNFQSFNGWTVGDPADTATSGVWVRAEPVGTVAQPDEDNPFGDGSLCFVTGNADPGASAGANDVDGGATTITSPVVDASSAEAVFLTYYRWYSNDQGANPGEDVFRVLASNDGGATWVEIESLQQSQAAWTRVNIRLSDFLSPTSQMVVRFVAEDGDNPSIVEAAIDDVRIRTARCARPEDLNADGQVDSSDLALLLGQWGAPGVADLNGNGVVDSTDLAVLLGGWGPDPAP